MGSEWKKLPLGDVIELKRGYDLPTRERIPGKYPIVSSSGVSGSYCEGKAEPPGVVTGRYGTIGDVYYINKPFWPLNTALYVRDFKGNHPRFISYLLQTINYQSYQDKGAVPGVNRNHLHLDEVLLPPLSEQRRIADILGTLDDKIDLNRRMNRTLEAMARALFKSWFVDFDPVRAKQRGEAPVGVDAETAALFPERLVDSELGEIPEGWGVGKLGDVSKVYGGSTPKTKISKYWDDPKHYWATPKDLSGQEMPILLDTIRKLSDAGLDNVTNGQRPAGTLLMSKRAPIGYLALARVPTAINQGFVALEPKGHVSNYFMLNWLNFNMELVKSRANGSTFKEISQTAFRNLPIVIPPREVVERYDALVDAFYVKIEANLRESQTLGEMRDVLLPELLSGKLKLKAT